MRTSNVTVPWRHLVGAAQSSDYASELTHPLYRYPASMSPHIARALILGLTREGDVVLDPFCGGGTTAIEVLASGRHAVCSDLNVLACFITRAKAWPLDQRALRLYQEWADSARNRLRTSTLSIPLVVNGAKYAPRTYGLLVGLRNSALKITENTARRLALLTVIRAGQLCFDCKKTSPYPSKLFRIFEDLSTQYLSKMSLYSMVCRDRSLTNGEIPRLKVLHAKAEHLNGRLGTHIPPIRLVLTSPPYPGVHVLYHRWQIMGRKETNLPYSLLNLDDGNYESHYSLGSRKENENRKYFQRLCNVYTHLKQVLDSNTIVAQVIAFTNPVLHLSLFRRAMDEAGYEELINPKFRDSIITRTVPHRRWYALFSPSHMGSKEYIFIHRLKL